MKRLNGKLIVSAVLAAAMISVSAVYAGAVDYSDEGAPVTVTPAEPTVLTDDDVAGAIAEAAAAGADEVIIEMEEDNAGSVTVQEAAIAEIAKSDVPVTVEIASSGSGVDYSVTIDPALIKEAKGINIAMDITVDSEEDMSVSGVDIPSGSVVIAPQQKGDFGMTLRVNLPAEAFGNMDLTALSMYYIGDDGSVTPMDSQFTVNDDGSVSVSITHASAYVISEVDLALENAVDDIGTDADDADVSSAANNITDNNPGTGVTVAFGALLASAAAVAAAIKRK